MKIGYARVSTGQQSLDLQITALKKAGCEKIFSEKITGTTTERPELIKALNFCRESDTLCVYKLDRLGRSMKHLIDLITQMENRGIQFQSLTENLDTNTNYGKMLFGIMSSLSEFHAALIRERVQAGVDEAKRKGKKLGRPIAMNEEQFDQATRMYNAGISVKIISKQLNISIPTIYRYLSKNRDEN